MSDDGSRVFFDSAASLVPQDVNGLLDVYEWERDGTGSCVESPGCVYLLSGGTSRSWSTLLEASASGDDVFFVSRAKLAPEDGNENFNVFDAHVGGVGVAAPVCSGSGCQGVPAASPVFATPASATFAGVGNFPSTSGQVAKPKAKQKAKRRGAAKKRRRRKRRRVRGSGARKAPAGERGRGGR
jgi:hypothetical protein